MRIESDVKLDFCDVLLKPKRSEIRSRKEISLYREFNFKYSPLVWRGVPVISSNMTSVTTEDAAKMMVKHDMMACLPKNWKKGVHQNYIHSFGLEDEIAGYPWLCLDVPNGYIEAVVDRTKVVREQHPHVILIVGNVVTAEQTEALILAGADVVKVGIGSGSACSTRIKTGVGMPQLSAIIDCADAAHGLGGHIISDGGCTTPGDVSKAFAAGADFVMLGGMLAGHDENLSLCSVCNGTGRKPILFNGENCETPCDYCRGYGKVADFYGMSSERGNTEFAGGLKDYRASEGWEIKLPDRGPIDRTLNDIEGGLRSACSYVGARSLKELPKRTTFIQVNRQANQFLWDYRL